MSHRFGPLMACALPAVALSACAGPRPVIPPEAVVAPPAQWRAASPAAAAIDGEWWKGFGDPVLPSLVERALAHNDDIAIAAQRVEEARAQFDLAEAQRLPNLVGAAGGARDRHVDAFGRNVFQTAGQTQLSISYDLDLFGRLRNASAAARAALLSTEAARDGVRLAVASAAASGYITLRSLDARLAVLKQTLAARADSLHLIRRRADAGYAAVLELRQAEAEYQATEQAIPAVELAIRRQEDGLSVLLGDSPRAIERGVTLDALALPVLGAPLPSDLLRRRPDIAQAEAQLVAADRSLDSVRAAFLPSFQLSGSGGYVASSLLMDDPRGVFSIGGSILGPIFDAGRLRAQQAGAAARRNAAAFAYRRVALNAFREVEDGLYAVQRLNEQTALQEQQRDTLAAAYQVAMKRYRSGYSPFLEQLDAQRSLLSAELTLVQLRADRLNATVSLYQALGGGWAGADAGAVSAGRP